MAFDSPMPARTLGTLGTLYLVARKTRQDVQSFPIDCERITIGRDYECDIRLYFNDVSKLHAEIIFDLITNKATLRVHGGNGITFTPQSGEASHQVPPAVLNLTHGDCFMLRKKLFRFEYGPEETIESPSLNTPTKAPAHVSTTESPAKPIRRRASHRLSLVPSGKEFAPHSPMKTRPLSDVLGPSKLSQAQTPVEEEEEEMNGPDEDLVDVVEGDEGDRVYLEMKDEDHPSQKPIYNNAFMTPQQKRKAPIPHTDAAPRTRISAPEFTNSANSSKNTATESKPGETSSGSSDRVSHTVALSTPRGPGSLRKSLLLKSARQTWKETQSPGLEGAIENGSVQTRRKSLSPRVGTPSKAAPPPDSSDSEEEEVEEQAPTAGEMSDEEELAEAAEEMSLDEDAESLAADVSLDIPESPLAQFSAPKIRVEHESMHQGPETYHEEEGAYNEEGEEADDDDDVPEDEDMEDEEEADVAGDVNHPALPGTPAAARTLSKFYTPQAQRSLGAPARSLATMGPAVRFKPAPFMPNFNARPVHLIPRSRVSLGPPSRGPARMMTPAKSPAVKREKVEHEEQEEEEEEDDVKPDIVGTPQRAANKAEAKRRRESLAALATPRRLPAPPASGFRNLTAGTPLKTFATPTHPALTATTPRRAPTAIPGTPLDDIKRRLELIRKPEGRRATVGFALPSTPALLPTINASASYTVIAASKRQAVFSFTSASTSRQGVEDIEADEEEEEMNASANQAENAVESDAEMEIDQQDVLPEQDEVMENPFVAGSEINDAIEYHTSALRAALDDEVVMAPVLPATAALNDILPQRPDASRLSLESSSIVSAESSSTDVEITAAKPAPATPSFAGLREMIHAPLPPKTPNFSGLKDLYPIPPVQQATPSFAGIRQMLAKPTKVPATPSFIGMKDMYRPQKVNMAPILDGVAELYDTPEHEEAVEESMEEEAEEEVEEEVEDMIEVQEEIEVHPVQMTKEATTSQPKVSTSKPSAPSALSAPSRSRAKLANVPAEPIVATTVPAKRARATKPTTTSQSAPNRKTTAIETTEPKSVPARTRRSATVESEPAQSMPARTRRAPTDEVEAPPKASSSRSRATRKADTVIEEEEPVKPFRARTTKKVVEKPVLGEADEQPTVEAKEEAVVKSSRAKKTAPAKTAEKSSEETSLPSRSAGKKVKEDKENEPAVVEKKPVIKRGVKKAEVEEVAPVAVRVTRSRK